MYHFWSMNDTFGNANCLFRFVTLILTPGQNVGMSKRSVSIAAIYMLKDIYRMSEKSQNPLFGTV